MSQPLIMSFRPDAAQMCLDGRKTVTRRASKNGDYIKTYRDKEGKTQKVLIGHKFSKTMGSKERIAYRVGDILSILPGRGMKAVGQVRVTDVALERLFDIPDYDVTVAECLVIPTRDEYFKLWQHMHPEDNNNPIVRVIRFEPVEKSNE